jgi:hypothetical protein
MPDPLTILGLSYAGKEAIAVVGEFAREIFGSSARAVGKGIAAPFEASAERRVEAAKSVIVDAALQVQAAGRNPRPVPARTLMPLLEKASLEEDQGLRRRWVTLLANAAMGPAAVLPAFVAIVGERSPKEARLLEHIYRHSLESAEHQRRHPINSPMNTEGSHERGVELISALQQAGLLTAFVDCEQTELLVYQANLERLNLVERGSYAGTAWDIELADWPITTTPVGNAFVAACMTPMESQQVV